MDKFYLSAEEKMKIEQFVQDEKMMSAVKKVLLDPIYYDGVLVEGMDAGDPIKNFALQKTARAIQSDPHITDEMLGQQVRADAQAVRYIELGFQELEKFKTINIEIKPEINEAR